MKKILLFSILTILFLSIGLSTFLITTDQDVVENNFADLDETTIESDVGNNTLKDKKVIFDYNDGNETPNFEYTFSSNNETNLTQETIASIPSPTYSDNQNHIFMGRYETKSGYYDDGTISKIDLSTYDFTANETVLYAKYTTKNSVFSLNSNGANDIYPGLVENTNPYFLSSQAIEDNFVINSGGSINLQFQQGKNFDSSLSGNTSSDTKIVDIENADIKVILENDIILDGGTIRLASCLGYDSNRAGLSIPITGKFTVLDLNGYSIYLLNGATIEGYGIITNSKNTGGIFALDGTIITPFAVADYQGGGVTTGAYTHAYSPFYVYSCPYLNVETIFTSNSFLRGYTSLPTSKILSFGGKNDITINLINNFQNEDCLININSGYLIRNAYSYQDVVKNFESILNNDNSINALINPDDFRESFVFTNDFSNKLTSLDEFQCKNFCNTTYDKCVVKLNGISMSLTMGIFDINVGLEYVDFSIPPQFDLKFYNCDIYNTISLTFFKGSSLFIDENSTIYMQNSMVEGKDGVEYPIFARLCFMDEYPVGFKYLTYSKTNNTYSASADYLGLNNYIYNSKYESNFNINGVFKFDNSNVDLNSNYKFYSIGGYVNLSDKCLLSLEKNKNLLRLNSTFCYIYCFYQDNGGLDKFVAVSGAYFYQQPLISNNIAYFQTNNQDFQKGKMVNSRLIFSNNKYYYYKYKNEAFTSNQYSCIDTGKVPPSEEEQKIKYNNVNGYFAECEYYKGENDYIVNSEPTGTYSPVYVLVCGAYIACDSIQDANGILKPNINGNGKVKIISELSRFGNIDVCKTDTDKKTTSLLEGVEYKNNKWELCYYE